MSQEKMNQAKYGPELKLAAVRRVLSGESVRAVAQELGIRRKRLYVWKEFPFESVRLPPGTYPAGARPPPAPRIPPLAMTPAPAITSVPISIAIPISTMHKSQPQCPSRSGRSWVVLNVAIQVETLRVAEIGIGYVDWFRGPVRRHEPSEA